MQRSMAPDRSPGLNVLRTNTSAPASSESCSRLGVQPTARMRTSGLIVRIRRMRAIPSGSSGSRGSMIDDVRPMLLHQGEGGADVARAPDDLEAVADAQDADDALPGALVRVHDEEPRTGCGDGVGWRRRRVVRREDMDRSSEGRRRPDRDGCRIRRANDVRTPGRASRSLALRARAAAACRTARGAGAAHSPPGAAGTERRRSGTAQTRSSASGRAARGGRRVGRHDLDHVSPSPARP